MSTHDPLSVPFLSTPMAAAATAATPAPTVRYERVSLLAEGGMGQVWLGWDHRIQRNVAIKRPLPGMEVHSSLVNEAAITAQLDHPGVVAVHDVYDEDGITGYVMAWVKGEPFTDRVRAHLGDPTPLLRTLLAAAEAVGHAHQRGVCHRDLSPANVLVGASGETYVIDWGMAAATGDGHALRCAGTPGFSAPELSRARAPHPTVDVWSLGALIHLAVHGVPPGGAAELRPMAPELAAVLSKALAPDPADRYASAGDVADDLRRWLDGQRVEAYDFPLWRLAWHVLRPWAPLLGAVTLGLVCTLGALAWGWTQQRAEAERAMAAAAEADRAAQREVEARRAAEQALADSLASRAADAWRRGDVLAAAELAEESLAAGRSPLAIGVSALAGALPRYEVVEETTLPDNCAAYAVNPAQPDRYACRTGDGEYTVVGSDGEEVYAFGGSAALRGLSDDSLLLFDAGGASRLDLGSGEVSRHNARLTTMGGWAEPAQLPPDADPRLGTEIQASAPDESGGRWVMTTSGGLWHVQDDGTARHVRDTNTHAPLLVADSEFGVWSATTSPQLVRLDQAAEPIPLPMRATFLAAPHEGSVWSQVGGVVRPVRLSDAAIGGAIPSNGSPFAVTREGDVWTREGDVRRRWSEAQPGAVSPRLDGGLATVSWAPDSASVYAGTGHGTVWRVPLNGHATQIAAPLEPSVVRLIEPTADGLVIVWSTELVLADGSRVFDSVSRRAAVLDDDTVVRTDFGSVRAHVQGEDVLLALRPEDGLLQDVEAVGDRWLACGDGGWIAGRGLDVTERGTTPAVYCALAATGHMAFIHEPDQVVVREPDGGLRTLAIDGDPTDVQFVPGRDALVIAMVNGEVVVAGLDGEHLATLPAHTSRASGVAASPDGRWLATVGWDARVVFADLGAIFAAAE